MIDQILSSGSVEWIREQAEVYPFLGPPSFFLVLFVIVDRFIPKTGKAIVAAGILGDGSGQSPRNISAKWFLRAFGRIYGFLKKKNVRRSFWHRGLWMNARALVVSVTILASTAIFLPGIWIKIIDSLNKFFLVGVSQGLTITFVLVAVAGVNAIFDVVSARQTFVTLGMGFRRQISPALVFIVDVLLTSVASFTFFLLFVVLTYFGTGDLRAFFLPQESVLSLERATPLGLLPELLSAAWEVFSSVFTTPVSDWTIVERLRFLLLFSTYFTTMWALAYSAGFVLVRIVANVRRFRDPILTFTPFQNHPLTSVGVLMFAMMLVPSFLITQWLDAADEQRSRSATSSIGPQTYYFAYDSSVVPPEGQFLASQLAEKIERNESLDQLCNYYLLKIDGYSDTSQSEEISFRLGLERAAQVARFLEAEGVPRNRMTLNSFGKTRLQTITGGGVREPLNRRVVINTICAD